MGNSAEDQSNSPLNSSVSMAASIAPECNDVKE